MSQPVNLNKFRKSKARVDGTTLAAANAVKFGQTKIEKKNARGTGQSAGQPA